MKEAKKGKGTSTQTVRRREVFFLQIRHCAVVQMIQRNQKRKRIQDDDTIIQDRQGKHHPCAKRACAIAGVRKWLTVRSREFIPLHATAKTSVTDSCFVFYIATNRLMSKGFAR